MGPIVTVSTTVPFTIASTVVVAKGDLTQASLVLRCMLKINSLSANPSGVRASVPFAVLPASIGPVAVITVSLFIPLKLWESPALRLTNVVPSVTVLLSTYYITLKV